MSGATPQAAQGALDAALRAEPPRRATVEDLEQLDEVHVDVIAAPLHVHDRRVDCRVHRPLRNERPLRIAREEAPAATHRWLAVASGACPIAAAHQQIRDGSRRRAHESSRAANSGTPAPAGAPSMLAMPVTPMEHGHATEIWQTWTTSSPGEGGGWRRSGSGSALRAPSTPARLAVTAAQGRCVPHAVSFSAGILRTHRNQAKLAVNEF